MPVLTNIRYELFAQAIAQGLDDGTALTRSGFKPNDVTVRRLKASKEISERIIEILREGATRAGATEELVMSELLNIAMFDLGTVAEWGNAKMPVRRSAAGRPLKRPKEAGYVILKNSKDLPPEIRRCVIEVRRGVHGVGIKTVDKMKAWDKIGQRLGLWKGPEGEDSDGSLADLIAAYNKRGTGEDARIINGSAQRDEGEKDDE